MEIKEQIEGIAKEVKADVQKVENEVKSLTEVNQKLQAQVDALEAKSNRQGQGAEEVKSPLLAALEAKKTELKGRGKFQEVHIALEGKAAVDMLRSNTGQDASQTMIATRPLVALPNVPRHVRDFMRITPLASPILKYDRELAPEGKPAMVAEGGLKPKVSFKTQPITAIAEKVAMHYKVTSELLHDSPAFAASLQGRGTEMVLTEEDSQLIYGTGTDGNLQGIYPLASAFDASDIKVDQPQNIDVLRIAVAQVRRSLYRANAILMHPDDVAEMELTKDSEGRYLLPTAVSGGQTSVGRVQIIELDAMNQGEFLAGAFDFGVDIYSVEDLLVKATDSNEDDFIKNKVTVVIEERLLQAITRPSAFVKGTFTAAKAALALVA